MIFVGKSFQLAKDFIIIGITEFIATSLTNLLQSVDDNEFGIGVFIHESLELFI